MARRSDPRSTSGPLIPHRCPFTILGDSNEYLPNHKGYEFANLHTNASDPGGRRPILVDVHKSNRLPVGDYSILGCYPDIIIERKTKEDLYASAARMDNFRGRLEWMAENATFPFVMVEAEFSDVRSNPPAYSGFNPFSLGRFIMSSSIKHHTRWLFMPGREWAEATTFRLLQFYWEHRRTP